jgi:hypothetical protein
VSARLAVLAVIAWSGSVDADPAVFRCAPGTAAVQGRGCLDGEVIGVLAAFEWDYTSKPDRLVRAEDPRFELGVGDDDREPQFPQPNAIALPATDGAGQTVLAKSRSAQLSEGEAYGVPGDAHLVRMRVNAGRGSAPGQRDFHAELIEILDGTPAYPLNVSKLLHATLQPFETIRTKQGKRWRTLLRAANAAAAKADAAANLETYDAPSESVDASYRATWLAETQTLRIVFHGELGRAYAKRVRPPPDPPPDPACEADPLTCNRVPRMRPKYLVTTRTYTATYELQIDFDKTGKAIATTEAPVTVAAPAMQTHDPS